MGNAGMQGEEMKKNGKRRENEETEKSIEAKTSGRFWRIEILERLWIHPFRFIAARLERIFANRGVLFKSWKQGL